MQASVYKVLMILFGAGCLLACSPATGYRSSEERWSANQATQPVAYQPPGTGNVETKPQNATHENIPTAAEHGDKTDGHTTQSKAH
jgi:hypothetical protein